tara:strand:- start:6356 stop:6598 length:243 start_codon:yes stop_codon:yes gene_type:complete
MQNYSLLISLLIFSLLPTGINAKANTLDEDMRVNSFGLSLSEELQEFNKQLTILERIVGRVLEVDANSSLNGVKEKTLDI